MKTKSLWSFIIPLIIFSTLLTCLAGYVGEFIARAQGVDEYRKNIAAIIPGLFGGAIWLLIRSYLKISPIRETRLNLNALYSVISWGTVGIVGTIWILTRFPANSNPGNIIIPLWSYVIGSGAGIYLITKHQIKGMRKEEVFQ